MSQVWPWGTQADQAAFVAVVGEAPLVVVEELGVEREVGDGDRTGAEAEVHERGRQVKAGVGHDASVAPASALRPGWGEAAQTRSGIHEPWNPNGTRWGNATAARRGAVKSAASRITKSLVSRAAS